MDTLFAQAVACHFRSQDHVTLSRKNISIAVEVVLDSGTQKKELVVRLTDDSDPFFLFLLRLGEDDFVSLKAEQGLLVDFGAFPQKLVELLKLCQSEQDAEVPRYVLQLVSNVNSGMSSVLQSNSSPSLLLMNFVETNPFKHLVHLSLRVMPAGDREIKRYLADGLKVSRNELNELRRKLGQTNESLGGQLAAAQQALAVKNAELERVRVEFSTRDSEISKKCDKAIEEERVRATAERQAMQQRFERDRETWEQAHAKIVRELEARLKEASGEAKQLGEKYHSLKLSVREWQSKASACKEEADAGHQELVALKKEITALVNDKHGLEKDVERLRTKLDGFQEQLRDKDAALARCQQLVDAEREQKHGVEEALEAARASVAKHDTAVKMLKSEVRRANDVIARLHDDNSALRDKVRLGAEVATAQEEKLTEAATENEQLKKNLEQVTTDLETARGQAKLLRSQVEDAEAANGDLRRQLDTNENMVTYLNKQLIERQLGPVAASNLANTPPMSTTMSSQRSSATKRVTFQASDETGVAVDGLAENLPQVSPLPRASPASSSGGRQPLVDRNSQDQPLDAKYFQPAGLVRRTSASTLNATTSHLSRHFAQQSSTSAQHPQQQQNNTHAYFSTPATTGK